MMKNSLVPQIIWLAFLLVLISAATEAQVKPDAKNDDEVIKVETELITVPVIVSDRQNRYIAGLKQNNFSILQDGKPQKIEFFVNEESPITVALMLDTSRSTQDVLDDIKDAAIKFIKNLRPNDRAMIVSFDNDLQILSNLSSDKQKLENAIENAEIGDDVGTVLNDAVSRVVTDNFKQIKGRKAVVLLTDGKDAGSYVSKNELEDQLKESDTMVYSIFYQTENNFQRRIFNGGGFRRGGVFGEINRRQNQRAQRVAMQNEEAKEFLQNIADETAGRFYNNKISELDQIFSSIADELRKQYVLGFYPENSTETNQNYQIKVQVDRPEAVVRAKSFYRRKSV